MSAFPLLMLVVIGGAFWFLVLRPARQRQQQQSTLLSNLKVGQEVMTTAGLFGTVKAINGDKIDLEIAKGVVVQYLNLAIAKIVEDDTPAPATDTVEETVVITDDADSATTPRNV